MMKQAPVERPAPEALTGTAPSAAPQGTCAAEGKARARTRLWVVGGAALVATVLVGSLVAATLPRLNQAKELNAAASQAASSPPLVSVATARRAPADVERTFPGNALAFSQAAL